MSLFNIILYFLISFLIVLFNFTFISAIRNPEKAEDGSIEMGSTSPSEEGGGVFGLGSKNFFRLEFKDMSHLERRALLIMSLLFLNGLMIGMFVLLIKTM